ncbi:hypothetical protein FHG12_10055 [Hymenobacter jejuensis]|uniref:Uncharacterized protein n=2 Tax=Hymenobacter jejuensis TaxID=2502781 RepID=A0A5B7ZYZ5_9BACT|nr:hypothetical protein FHG12_10055 [Hymenobacter jejuensis]
MLTNVPVGVMSLSISRVLRRSVGFVLLSVLLLGACRPYRLPTPTGPPQPKVKASKVPADQAADGRTLGGPATEIKPQKNSYDKHGLLKKSKYERRRLKHKVGQRKFLGITLPF